MKKVDFTEFLLRNCLGILYISGTLVHLLSEFLRKLSKLGQNGTLVYSLVAQKRTIQYMYIPFLWLFMPPFLL